MESWARVSTRHNDLWSSQSLRWQVLFCSVNTSTSAIPETRSTYAVIHNFTATAAVELAAFGFFTSLMAVIAPPGLVVSESIHNGIVSDETVGQKCRMDRRRGEGMPLDLADAVTHGW